MTRTFVGTPSALSERVPAAPGSFELDPQAVLDALGAWAPISAVILAVACGLLCVPMTAAAVAAGVVFGPREGLLVGGVAIVLSGLTNFVVARHLWRGRVEERLRRHPRFARLDKVLGDGGGRVLALLRMSPVVPWAPVSYAAGLSGMRMRTYAWTCLAMLPLALLYARLGAFAGDLGAAAWDRVADEIEPWAVPMGTLLVVLAIGMALHVVARSSDAPFLPRKDATP